MIDPNRNISEEVLERCKRASYERFRIQLMESIEKLMGEFDITWDDLAEKLQWEAIKLGGGHLNGDEVKNKIGDGFLTTGKINDIAHCFSAEAHIIFRPRFPYTAT
jgi:hypothetical protein